MRGCWFQVPLAWNFVVTDLNKSTLEYVTPLSQPRSVHKCNVEGCFLGILSQNGQMTLKVKVNNPHFQYQPWEWCIFGDCNSYPSQVITHGQGKFPRILSQNGQNDLEGQGLWPPFSIPAESILGCMFGANLVILAQSLVDASMF